ncbi:acyl-CoA dehydrogenase family protein [Pseudonocardia ailaonensis]|uniref:Acyl-CoA dehydrogenase family protein n=1 Tax=Pseudonocardia ailaonensis TaxID=367279 RepID=A0ABN2NAE5_9PSEU
MAWDFETPPELAAQLSWVREFVADEVELLDHVIGNPHDTTDPVRNELVRPLQEEVRRRGLWAAHLTRVHGGAEFDQVAFVLLNEQLGRSRAAPVVFGCQAPDAGNQEILSQFGSPGQRERFLVPSVAGDIATCFAVTEPTGGADPTRYRTRADKVSGGWELHGRKWFASGFGYAGWALVMATTDDTAPRHDRATMFILPTDLPGIRIERRVASGMAPEGPIHAFVTFDGVHVPDDLVLGSPGEGFRLMQQRLGRARLALAARMCGLMRWAFELMQERAVSREVGPGLLGSQQLAQKAIADTWTDIETFRLLLLRTAWRLDRDDDLRRARADISAVKSLLPEVLNKVARRAAQLHGSLGASQEMPFVAMAAQALSVGVADGPSEVHTQALARALLRGIEPSPDLFPSYHLPRRRAEAYRRHRAVIERFGRVIPEDVSSASGESGERLATSSG